MRLPQRAQSHYRDNRPGFDRGHGLADRSVFLHIDRAVHWAVPHRRFVGPIDHVDLDLDRPAEHRVAPVLGNRLQPVTLPLEEER